MSTFKAKEQIVTIKFETATYWPGAIDENTKYIHDQVEALVDSLSKKLHFAVSPISVRVVDKEDPKGQP